MNIVIVGHVDHGKSTLVGRLLSDTGSLFEGHEAKIRGICERQGKVFEYAFLLDALEAEQDQGITIDAARCFFKSQKRDYIIIDAPGHIEFLKNMITGAARAEAAVLLIDAAEGVRENSRRHGYLLSMLGVGQVVVAVNKMDLVGYDRATFERIEAEYRAFLKSCGVTPDGFVPIAARGGDNLSNRSENMPWYAGPTILESVDAFKKEPPRSLQVLRLPVQDVYKFNARGDDRRIIAGRIESGRVKVGDRIVFSPSGKTSTVKSIEAFSAAPRTEAVAGESVGLTLTEQVYVRRGDVASRADARPLDSTLLRASVFWLGKSPMVPDKRYKLKLGTAAVEAVIHEIVSVIDASQLAGQVGKRRIDRHEVAEVILRTKSPIAFDRSRDIVQTGRFVLVDGYDTVGGGIVRDVVTDDEARLRSDMHRRQFEWVKGLLTMADREQKRGHRAGLVLFSGEAGTGKAELARHLEVALFDRGVSTYLLDGTNVLLGVEHVEEEEHAATREQLVRRYGEVANLFVDSGMIVVSTTNTIALGDHQKLATIIAPAEMVSIHVCPHHHDDAPLSTDLVLPGVEEPGQAVAEILALLDSRGFFTV